MVKIKLLYHQEKNSFYDRSSVAIIFIVLYEPIKLFNFVRSFTFNFETYLGLLPPKRKKVRSMVSKVQKKANALCIRLIVAGAGLEPTTFGL